MRGQFRVYLGSAPGVGKTYRMLDEGWRRRERGHRRGDRATSRRTSVPRPTPKCATWRSCRAPATSIVTQPSKRWTSMRCWRAHPEVALSWTSWRTQTPPGSGTRSAGRTSKSCWTRASTSLPRSTSNTWSRSTTWWKRSPASLSKRRSPTAVVRQAQQIELVDVTPEALRRRMAHGNIYTADKIDASLSNYFRVGNLSALARARAAVAGRSRGGRPAAISR